MASAANKPITPITLVLVAGSNYQAREAWIATATSHLPPSEKSAALLEGLPSGVLPLQSHSHFLVERIAPGCFCCIGQLALRVTLNRLLRQGLTKLYIAMNDVQHLTELQRTLSLPPYDLILKCEKVIRL